MTTLRFACFLLNLAAVWRVCVAEPASAAGVPVTVETLGDAEPVSGRLKAINRRDVTLELETGERRTVPRDQILSLSAADLARDRSPAIDATGWLILTTGDLLRLQPLFIDDTSLTARWEQFPALAHVTIPLELCRGCAFSVSTEPARQGREFVSISRRTVRSDLVTLRNGDQIDGEFVGFGNESVTINTQAGKIDIEATQIRTLAFNPELISQPPAPPALATLLLRDGSTLWLSDFSSDGDVLIGTLLAGVEISLPVSIVRELRLFDVRRLPLSTALSGESTVLTQQVTSVPYLSSATPDRQNRNVLGSPLSVQSRVFGTGIGTLSGSTRTIQIDSRFDEFRTAVGIDDAAGVRGSVVFEIQADGQTVWRSPVMTGSSPAVTVPAIPLSGVKTLSLRTEFADHGDVCDFANWLNPVLLDRSSPLSQRFERAPHPEPAAASTGRAVST